jgi:hypothetical protein
VALVSLAALGVASRVSAQDGTDTARRPILERVAEKLGIDVETLRGAFKDARLDAVDDAVANGAITEEQAAKARERIEQGKPLRYGHRAAALRVRRAIVESAAGAIGMTLEELREELKAGKSIADVAGEHGVSIDNVKSRIVSDATTKLDELVADGRIDQARADAALAKLQERLDTIVTRKRS